MKSVYPIKSFAILFAIQFALFSNLFGQTYNNPGGTISTCSGTFYDSGGSSSTYSINEYITTTFCSDNGGQITINFSSFSTENGYDFLYIYDGPSTASTYLGFASGTGTFSVTSTGTCLTFVFDSDYSNNGSGWVASISCSAPPVSGCTDPLASNYDPTATIDDGSCTYAGGVYYHPTTGLLSSYSGACPVATDAGIYYDDGGAGSNYSDNINSIYRTFCPSTEGECVRLTFASFETYNSNDYLVIQNGPAQNSTSIASLSGNLNASVPFSYQATNSSGCLTVRFTSSSIYNDPGWAASISNVPCTEAQPVNNSDCSNATPICSNTSFTGVSNGPGIVTNEGCDACLTGEVYSNWYTFTVQSGGTIGLTIAPNSTADYDFTLYKGSCGGTMERCSFAPQTGNTGLGNGASDTSEGVTGDSWVSTINVNAGDVFYLMINSWTATGPGFNLVWNLTNGASLDCTILPVELAEFEVSYDPLEKGANIFWKTETEKDNDHFILEKSVNNEDFEPLYKIEGAGTTSHSTEYFAFDPNVSYGVSYYRLKQVDENGEFEYSEVRSIHVFEESLDKLTISPNPTNDHVRLFFNSYYKDDARLIVSDFTGKALIEKNINVQKSGNAVILDVSDFEKGIYVVKIVTNQKIYSGRIIKK